MDEVKPHIEEVKVEGGGWRDMKRPKKKRESRKKGRKEEKNETWARASERVERKEKESG